MLAGGLAEKSQGLGGGDEILGEFFSVPGSCHEPLRLFILAFIWPTRDSISSVKRLRSSAKRRNSAGSTLAFDMTLSAGG